MQQNNGRTIARSPVSNLRVAALNSPGIHKVHNEVRSPNATAVWLAARSFPHSHSIVPGGLEVMSYTTRFTPFTSFTMRVEIFFSTSCDSGTQSAVIPSSELTPRMAQV